MVRSCGTASVRKSKSFSVASARTAPIVGAAGPLDHHGYSRGLESPSQHLRLELRPLAELDETTVLFVVELVGIVEMLRALVDERDPAIGTGRRSNPVLGAARRTP